MKSKIKQLSRFLMEPNKAIEKKCYDLENKLKETIFHYETLINSGQALIWTSGMDKKCNYFNKTWLDFTGRTLEQEMGDGWSEGVHPEDIVRCFNTYSKAFDKRKKFSMEYRLRHSSGEYRWIQDDGSPRYNMKGEFVGYIGHCLDISQRKHSEQSLKNQKNEFETIFNLVPAQIWYKDTKNRFLRVNKRVCTDTGFERYELEGHNASEVFPAFGKKYYNDDLSVILSGKPKFGIEEQINTKEGDLRWLHTDKIPVFDENEKVKGMIAFVQDFTEQKKNKERWESLFNNSPNAIAVYEAVDEGNDFIFTDFNLKAEETDHINRQNVIGKRISQLFPSAEGLGFLEIFKKVWRTGKTEYIHSSFYKDDRIEGWRENIIYRLNTGEIVTIYTDISAKMKAEIALRQSEEKFRSIFEDHSAIEFLIDPENGNITDVNQAAANFYGWSVEELKQMNIRQLNLMNSEDIQFNMNKVVVGKQNRFEFHHQLKDGSVREVEIFCSKAVTGEKIYLHSIVHDITERKRAEEARKLAEAEIIKAKEKAEESDSLKTAFLHNISHEIRTPLNAIVGFSGLLNDPSLIPDNRQKYTQIIMQSSEQLLSIITDIINISTIEANQSKVYMQNFSINTLMKQMYTKYIDKAKKNNIEFHFEMSFSDTDDFIISDKSKLETILSNLLCNALKFTKEGSISFGYQLKDSFLEFYVEDTGIGISKDKFDEIFKRFRQVEIISSRQYGGLGLGLSLSKAYVELLGGKIGLTSELGQGSRFVFTIPHNIEVPIDQTSPSPGIQSLINLMIAEDDDANFMLLNEYLSDFNLNIIRAENGLQAVNLIKSHTKIDLILMDIKMPIMGGLEATQIIKKWNPNQIIIAQSAFAYPEEKQKAFEAGCDAFISKPIKKEELIHSIHSMLNSKNPFKLNY